MRRNILLLTLAAIVAVMLVTAAGPVLADSTRLCNKDCGISTDNDTTIQNNDFSTDNSIDNSTDNDTTIQNNDFSTDNSIDNSGQDNSVDNSINSTDNSTTNLDNRSCGNLTQGSTCNFN